MTPREFAEHVERESDEIARILEAVQDAFIHGNALALTSLPQAVCSLSELNSLARQHAIEQERNHESR